MAAAAVGSLLDELMGKNRNACNGKSLSVHWSDDDICKFFLCGFCPHELFVNTRSDLGPCPYSHDEKLRDKYRSSKRYEKMGYEQEFAQNLRRLVGDVDNKILHRHERLSHTKSVDKSNSGVLIANRDKVKELTEQINELLKEAEELGSNGNIDQSKGVLKLCDELKDQRSQLCGNECIAQTKELEVCEICGAFRIKDDAPQRVEEHLSGKMHVGFAKIRDYLREFEKKKVHSRLIRDRRAGGYSDCKSLPTREQSRRTESSRNNTRHNFHDSRGDKHRRRSSRSHDRRRHHHEHSHYSRHETSPFSAPRRLAEGEDFQFIFYD